MSRTSKQTWSIGLSGSARSVTVEESADEVRGERRPTHSYGDVPFVCGRIQGFGTKGSAQRRVSGDWSTTTSSRKNTGTDTGIGVLALPGVWLAFLPSFFWASLSSVPTLARLCRHERLQMRFYHMLLQSVTRTVPIFILRVFIDAGLAVLADCGTTEFRKSPLPYQLSGSLSLLKDALFSYSHGYRPMLAGSSPCRSSLRLGNDAYWRKIITNTSLGEFRSQERGSELIASSSCHVETRADHSSVGARANGGLQEGACRTARSPSSRASRHQRGISAQPPRIAGTLGSSAPPGLNTAIATQFPARFGTSSS